MLPYLDVPYADKDAAKDAGARFDWDARRWYAPHGLTPALMRWSAPDTPMPEPDDLLEDAIFGPAPHADDIGWCRNCCTYQKRSDTPVRYFDLDPYRFEDPPGEWRHGCPNCPGAWGESREVQALYYRDAIKHDPELPWGWWLVATCLHQHAAQQDVLHHLACRCPRAHEYIGVPVMLQGNHRLGGETDFRRDYVVYQTAAGDYKAALLNHRGGAGKHTKLTDELLAAATNDTGRATMPPGEYVGRYERLDWARHPYLSHGDLTSAQAVRDIQERNRQHAESSAAQ